MTRSHHPSGTDAPPATRGRRAQILRSMQEHERPMTVVELAERLDVHANTVRFHLDSLVAAGQVEQLAPAPDGPGRPPLRYRARLRMDPDGPRSYRMLAELLVTHLESQPDPAVAASDAGRSWGRQLVASIARPR